MKTWSQVWDEKALAIRHKAVNQEIPHHVDLLRINGFNHDSNSQISPESLEKYISTIAGLISNNSISYLYEFGCGTGFFTQCLASEMKLDSYGGSDASVNMIEVAKAQNPKCEFEVSDAFDFHCEKQGLSIVCNSVFQYFPNLGYARGVIENVLAHNPVTFAFLDIVRSDSNGSLTQREGDNDSQLLTHLGFNQSFFLDQLASSDYEIQIVNQDIPGYYQSNQRFNVIGLKKNP
jgi:hypothetical protein